MAFRRGVCQRKRTWIYGTRAISTTRKKAVGRGRIIKAKDVFFILEILDNLPEKFPFHMVFVGSGPDEKELRKRTEELGLSARVTFTGNISDRELLKAFYLRSDLFLFPSRYDVSSIVQIEAAAQKLCGLFRRGSVTSCTVQDLSLIHI